MEYIDDGSILVVETSRLRSIIYGNEEWSVVTLNLLKRPLMDGETRKRLECG